MKDNTVAAFIISSIFWEPLEEEFSQARRPSCHPTNSVEALRENLQLQHSDKKEMLR